MKSVFDDPKVNVMLMDSPEVLNTSSPVTTNPDLELPGVPLL